MRPHRYMTAEQRFWSQVDKTPTCWLWTGSVYHRGYGRTSYRGEAFAAHRLSYLWAFGEHPGSLCVCHVCDTPRCVRQEHLFLGTALDNKRDCVQKGRHATGETNGNALLTQEQARAIRALYAEGREGRGQNHFGKYRQIDLAVMFGVKRATIANIVDNRNWVAA